MATARTACWLRSAISSLGCATSSPIGKRCGDRTF
jgi:hypothetical protein